jgi:large exoprotein involved in heme utilization and adhesion
MGAVGNAGEININTANLDLTNGSVISASTLAQGDGGRIDINATESVSFDGNMTAIFNLVGTDAVGTGGEINITTANLNLTNGGQIVATTRGQGDAGKIDINATESVTFDGTTPDGQSSGIGGVVVNDAIGNAGEINIITPNLSLTNGGRIASSTLGEGDAGRIEINATESITLDGKNPNNNLPSAIENKVEMGAVGNGGGIDITTPNLVLTNSGQISVSSLGIGDSGSISVNADNLILNNGEISAANTPTESTANNQTPQVGGNINLEVADSINLRNNSLISAQAFNNANGGNVNIDANFIIAFPNENSLNGNNDIRANAQQGQGGIITIDVESLLGIQERQLNPQTNDINASSDVLGLDGTVTINTPDINPVQGTTQLPTNVVEPEQTTEQACQANREAAAKNGLVINGKGGVPPTPEEPLTSQNLLINGEITSASAIPEPIKTSQGKIHLARGIKFTEDGRIILTAYRTNNAGERLPAWRINCGQI